VVGSRPPSDEILGQRKSRGRLRAGKIARRWAVATGVVAGNCGPPWSTLFHQGHISSASCRSPTGRENATISPPRFSRGTGILPRLKRPDKGKACQAGAFLLSTTTTGTPFKVARRSSAPLGGRTRRPRTSAGWLMPPYRTNTAARFSQARTLASRKPPARPRCRPGLCRFSAVARGEAMRGRGRGLEGRGWFSNLAPEAENFLTLLALWLDRPCAPCFTAGWPMGESDPPGQAQIGPPCAVSGSGSVSEWAACGGPAPVSMKRPRGPALRLPAKTPTKLGSRPAHATR